LIIISIIDRETQRERERWGGVKEKVKETKNVLVTLPSVMAILQSKGPSILISPAGLGISNKVRLSLIASSIRGV